MAWIGVVTNAGLALLEAFAAGGHTLTLDGASVGAGTVSEANLRLQTAVSDVRDSASIVSAQSVDGGTKYKFQVGPATTAAYTAHQVGLFAHLDSAASVLLALYQDSAGVSVPLKSESPNYAFGLHAVLAIANDASVIVNIDESAYVTGETLAEALSTKPDVHRFTATIPATGWTQNADGLYTVTVSVPGILASDQDGDVGLVQSGSESTDAPRREAYGLLVRVSAAADAIVAYALAVPEVTIPVRLEVIR